MKLRVFFENFWPGWNRQRNNFTMLLARRFEMRVVPFVRQADVVFESYFKSARLEQRLRRMVDLPREAEGPIRIFFSGEPLRLPIGRHHAVISGNVLASPNHFRYPMWMLNFPLAENGQPREAGRFGGDIRYEMVQRPLDPDAREKFACAIFSTPYHYRYEAVRQLRTLGEVDLFGKPVGRPVPNKLDVMRQYRYNLCLENTVQPGYVTEKPVEARAAGCIPLWWGDPSYRLDFHERAIVNLYEYGFDLRRVFDEVDFKTLAQTPLLLRHPDQINAELEEFLHHIITTPPREKFLEAAARPSAGKGSAAS